MWLRSKHLQYLEAFDRVSVPVVTLPIFCPVRQIYLHRHAHQITHADNQTLPDFTAIYYISFDETPHVRYYF